MAHFHDCFVILATEFRLFLWDFFVAWIERIDIDFCQVSIVCYQLRNIFYVNFLVCLILRP